MRSSDLQVISRQNICKQVGISKDTIRNWIKNRNFPKPLISSGRDPLFNLQEVNEWFFEYGGNDEK